jgi:hypothetical protein
MKKFAMAAVAAAAMTVGVANAYTVGGFSNGVVIPNVIHNGTADTTAIGVIANGAAGVYWTFFDQNSKHITDGCFPVTDKMFKGIVWADPAVSGTNTAGVRGYMVLTTGVSCSNPAPTTSTIAANAFHVTAASSDVAYVPVIDGPLTLDYAGTGTTVTTMNENTLTGVAGAAQVSTSTTFNMRYFIDGATGGTDTRIVVWSVGDQKRTHTVDMYDNAQNRKSVNFTLANTELDWFDPETIVGRPATFLDGFIEWNATPASFGRTTGPVSVFTYSVISAPAFGAVQTILGAHR